MQYAFRNGNWMVLALPLFPGGTLQSFLDETNDRYVADAAAGGMLWVESVEWVGACLTLSLEHLHGVVRSITPTDCSVAEMTTCI